MPEDTTEQEDEESEQLIQPWKWMVIGALALPSLLFSPDMAYGAGQAVGAAGGMAIIFVIATMISRRFGISDLFQPRTWKAIAAVSVVPGFVVAAEPQSMAFHGFFPVFLFLFVGGAILKVLRKGGTSVVGKVSEAVR